jgi:hypothetical protein
MRFIDVDDIKGDLIAILLVELVERGNLPAKGWSSVTAKDEHDGLFAAKGGQCNRARVVEQREREIGSLVADLQMAAASLFPHAFKGKQEKRNWAGVLHDARKFVRRLVHGVVEEGEDAAVNNG